MMQEGVSQLNKHHITIVVGQVGSDDLPEALGKTYPQPAVYLWPLR